MVSYRTVCPCDGKWKIMWKKDIGSWAWRGQLVMWVPHMSALWDSFHLGRLCFLMAFSCLHTVRMHKWVIHPPTFSENANALDASWTQLLHTPHANRTEYCTNEHIHCPPWRNTAIALFAYFLKLSPGKYSVQVQFILHDRRIWSSFCPTSFQSAVSSLSFWWRDEQ